MKIAVVCGGLSNERDVSITSGTGAARELRKKGHQVVLVDLYYGYAGEYDDPAELFEREQEDIQYSVKVEVPDVEKMLAEGDGTRIGKNVVEICRAADIAFLALHGDDGENGKLQALLDMYGVKYTGSGYLGCALSMNKEITKELFRENGIPNAPGIVLEKGQTPYADPGFPCVVKPCSGGSSIGTSVVKCREDYEAALDLAFTIENRVVVESFVDGSEFAVGVIDGKALPVLSIVVDNGWYDYKAKYQAGLCRELCPAPISAELTERLQRTAEKVGKALMIDVYYRADFIVDKKTGDIYCLEANSLPGMTPSSHIPQMAAAEGMDYGELCEKIIAVSMEKYK